MRSHTYALIALTSALIFSYFDPSACTACTTFVATPGASVDGSTLLASVVDGYGPANLELFPSVQEPKNPSASVDLKWPTGSNGVLNRFMNEYQVSIAESDTATHRSELGNGGRGLMYAQIMVLALQRSKTAREAIAEIDRISNRYGYGPKPVVLSIADKNEAWIMEIVGKGETEIGAVWVAARVPDGYVTALANASRITTFPMDDPENWLYASDVVEWAVEKGYHDPESGEPFSFRTAYHPKDDKFIRKACFGRIWSIYRRIAPSQDFSDAYHRGVEGAEPYPLFIKPDKKVGVLDVMNLMRDHYEGTKYDMTKGLAAGPFGCPYRFRGMHTSPFGGLGWTIDGKQYCWERPISCQHATCAFIAQSRSWLPDALGGVVWFAPDDAFTSCYVPVYCGITEIAEPYTNSDPDRFSWESAWWVSSLVANYTYDRWHRVIPDVVRAQKQEEEKSLKEQPIMEAQALELFQEGEDKMRAYLTEYSKQSAHRVFERWRQLAGEIIVSHNDGWVRMSGGFSLGLGYPAAWYESVVNERPEYYLISPGKTDHKERSGEQE